MSSRRVRQHVNPLRSDLLDIGVEPVRSPDGAAIEVELGSAEAHFLIGRAAEEPENFYVGVEIRDLIVDKANRACRKAGHGRVLSVFANMSTDLQRLFAPSVVTRFFLNFPDPWWKPRQQKRRVADDDLVSSMMRVLSPHGEIHVATDIFAIALDAMAALEAESRLANLAGPWTFLKESLFSARSRRERQCEQAGDKIWRLAYRRR